MILHPALQRDERGAIMLIAVFFAIFGISILYLAVGAGQTVLFREHLQDAADSAALSGAITRARLMNVIVLINLVMAALVAILLTLKLVEGLAIVGIAIAAGLAFFTGGSSLAAVPPLNALRSNMANLYDSLKPDIFEVLKVLNDVSDKTIEVAPAAAEVVALSEIHGGNDPVASAGFITPTLGPLPLAEERYSKLCEHAGELVEKIAAKPFEGIPGLEQVIGTLLSPISTLAGAMSEWFCGDGGYSLPDLSQKVDHGYPAPANAEACQNEDIDNMERGQEWQATSDACAKTEAAKAAAQPDAQGYCQTECGLDGPYEYAVKQARVDCNPSGDPRPSAYRFQLQNMRVEYQWDGTTWVKGSPTIVSSEVVLSKEPPCGPKNVDPTVAEGYNLVVHPADDPSRVALVCSSEKIPELPEPDPDDDSHKKLAPDPVSFEYRQVPQIFSCMRLERAAAKVGEGKASKQVDDDAKSPKRVKDNVHLGSETFQVRAAVFGDPEARESSRLVRLGLWGKSDPDNPFERVRYLGGFSVAQAEYYYSGSGERDSWMWNMSWRARLKRLDVVSNQANHGKNDGEEDPIESLSTSCAMHVGSTLCAKMLVAIELTAELLVH